MLEQYKKYVSTLSHDDLVDLAAKALYHLHAVSGSRNSFDWNHPTMQQALSATSEVPLKRTVQVAEMHMEAAHFIALVGKQLND